jgi:hypothetical protein
MSKIDFSLIRMFTMLKLSRNKGPQIWKNLDLFPSLIGFSVSYLDYEIDFQNFLVFLGLLGFS